MWREIRTWVRGLVDDPTHATGRQHLHADVRVRILLPFEVADYVDFYASEFHASNVGKIFRPDSPDLPPPGSTCRSAITAAPAPSSSAAPKSCGRRVNAGPAPTASRRSARATSSTSSARSASSWTADPRAALRSPSRGARPHLRRRPAQRLERARHPGLGVRAARPVPGQVLRDLISAWVMPFEALRRRRVHLPGLDPPVLPYFRARRSRAFGLDLHLEVVNGYVVSARSTGTCTGPPRRCWPT